MESSSDKIDDIIDDLIADMTASATQIGLTPYPPIILERDEAPSVPLEGGYIPCAYVIPILGTGMFIDFNMGGPQNDYEFGITVTAYYNATEDDVTSIDSDLRRIRGYMLNFVDLYRTKNRGMAYIGQGWIRNMKLDQGYYVSGGGEVVHYWIDEITVTTKI